MPRRQVCRSARPQSVWTYRERGLGPLPRPVFRVNVYLTVDTEVWPVRKDGWPAKPLTHDCRCDREVDAYFYGRTKRGDYGLAFQLEMFREYALTATFFIDPLFSFALGLAELRRVVELVQTGGQSVALHLHPEWLSDPRCEGFPRFRGPLISGYPEEAQRALVKAGMQRLRDAGAQPLPVFRAGSWGADVSTLRALRDEGIFVDSSLNAAYADSLPSFPNRASLQEPTEYEGVLEFPMTRLDDRMSDGRTPAERHWNLMVRDAIRTRVVLCGRTRELRVGDAQQRVRQDGAALERAGADAAADCGPPLRASLRLPPAQSRPLSGGGAARRCHAASSIRCVPCAAEILNYAHGLAIPVPGRFALVLTQSCLPSFSQASSVWPLSTNSTRSRCGLIMNKMRRPPKAAAGTGLPRGRYRLARNRAIVASRSSTS